MYLDQGKENRFFLIKSLSFLGLFDSGTVFGTNICFFEPKAKEKSGKKEKKFDKVPFLYMMRPSSAWRCSSVGRQPRLAGKVAGSSHP